MRDWDDYYLSLWLEGCRSKLIDSNRVILPDSQAEIYSNNWSYTAESFGFTSVKVKLFEDQYVIPGELERVRDVLSKKKFGSVFYYFKSEAKNSSHHKGGQCLIGIRIVKLGTKIVYEVVSRTNEAAMRLGFDITFISQQIQSLNDTLRPSEYVIRMNSGLIFFSPLETLLVSSMLNLPLNFNEQFMKQIDTLIEWSEDVESIKRNRIRRLLKKYLQIKQNQL